MAWEARSRSSAPNARPATASVAEENAVPTVVRVHTTTVEIWRLASAVVSVRPRTIRSTMNTSERSSMCPIAGHASRSTSRTVSRVSARTASSRDGIGAVVERAGTSSIRRPPSFDSPPPQLPQATRLDILARTASPNCFTSSSLGAGSGPCATASTFEASSSKVRAPESTVSTAGWPRAKR